MSGQSPWSSCSFADATRCRTDDRYWLGRLCRCIARPAFADDPLPRDGAECVTFELKTTELMTPGRDGRTQRGADAAASAG